MFPKLSLHQSEIFFGSDAFSNLEALLSKKFKDKKIIILTDENVSALWSENLVTNFQSLSRADIIEIPAGEENKNLEICQVIWEALSEYEINRQDLIINLGGGMVCDLGGFVASVYKRGIQFINIPTTLLAQVDASVGGKTGIDLGPYKNQVGTFSHPFAVFVNPEFLTTLPNNQITSGYAEMLKHGLIADKNHWDELIQLDLSKPIPEYLIYQSICIKHQIVQHDFEENHERKKLNFGHTIGHAIEGSLLNTPGQILHGHAVALGMVAESFIAKQLGKLSAKEFEIIHQEIRNKFSFDLKLDSDRVMLLMRNDKKNSGDNISFTLVHEIGKAEINQFVENKLIQDAIEFLSAK